MLTALASLLVAAALAQDPVVPPPAPVIAAASVDLSAAWHAARQPELLGASSAASTGMTARRVVEEGLDWKVTATVEAADVNTDPQVSLPFSVTSRGERVVATQLVEQLATRGLLGARLALTGRALDVDGVTYVVLTAYRAPNP